MTVEARPSWHEYFSQMAIHAASRGTCPRAKVGCVLVYDNNPVSTGYNGAIADEPHCSEVGCEMVNDHCIRSRHAERNAIDLAAKGGKATKDAIAYVTHTPCRDCYASLVQAGIIAIIYSSHYRPDPYVANLSTRRVPLIYLADAEADDHLRY